MECTYLTTTQAAERLALQPRTLERWRWAGIGPKYRKLNGAVRYTQADLDEFADAALRRSTSDRGPGPQRAA